MGSARIIEEAAPCTPNSESVGNVLRGGGGFRRVKRLPAECCKGSFGLGLSFIRLGFPGGSDGEESACSVGDPGSISGSKDPLADETATHSSILIWEVPWTEKPGRLQSLGSERVRHAWATNTFTFTFSAS